MRKMTATYPARWLSAVVLLALAAGCGSEGEPERPRDGSLTVYSSLPRTGIQARQASAVAAGQRLALRDAGGRAGGRDVRLVELDSAGGEGGPWDPDAVEANANRAVDDESAVAYLGELDLGASAVSVPVTNADGLLQVTPGDGLPSLTVADPGGGGESPVRYYPEGNRTFVRVIPHAGLQAQLLVAWAGQRGARSIAVVRDDGVFGRELANWTLEMASRAGLPAEAERIRPDADDYEDVAREVAERRPGAVVYTGQAGPDTDIAVAALRRALPGTPLLATSAVSSDPPDGVDFVDTRLPADEYGARARRVLRRLGRDPGALYGYQAMRLVLDAIERGGDRAAVLRAAMGPRRVDELLPPYFLGPGGDAATSAFGAYRSASGRVTALGVRSAESGRRAP
jgi:branched-chain amino acid transport system substrate-binding protein